MKTKVSLIVLLAITIICLVSYFLHSTRETSGLENRSLMTFHMVIYPPPEDSIIYKDTVSERLEEALKDQIIGRDRFSLYYTAYTAFLDNLYTNGKRLCCNIIHCDRYDYRIESSALSLPFFPTRNYEYSKIGSLYRFGDSDYIFEGPNVKLPDTVQIAAHVAQIEHIHNLYPNIKFYSYFVRPLSSTKWFDGQLDFDTPNYFEEIAQSMPSYMKMGGLVYQDDEEYKRLFYKSDHHWNSNGYMRGYEDIYNMISNDLYLSDFKQPVKMWNFSELYGLQYRGSRAAKLQMFYDGWDEFIVPEYDLGDRKCYSIDLITGEEVPVTLCLWAAYKNGEMPRDKYRDHYIDFYYSAFDSSGKDYSNEHYLIRNTGSNTGHNLLFVTDSTGRAIRDVLASHFDSLIYLDYRNMSQVKVDEIIEKYNIDTILMSGLGAVWTGKKYNFHFTDGFGEEN